MKAVILAAGYNRRLKNIIDIPKTLLKVGDTTILERQINALVESGLKKEDIFVVSGYKREMIEKVHNNIIINEKYIEYDNAYSVYLALKYLLEDLNTKEEILIFDGDLIYDVELIKPLIESEKEDIFVTRETPYSSSIKDETMIVNQDNEIMQMIIPSEETPLDKYKDEKLFVYTGILKLSEGKANELKRVLENPELWKTWYTIPLPNIVNKGGFYNLPIRENIKFCFDIDDKKDLEKLRNLKI
ncbi:MAG TPA: hypothetical protein ENG87_00670 [Candidatus Pacearchaeota archaeon]|nr:bifunctional protein GlmU [archaeon BMS3Abin17]HDK41862.1 hypothetical protein [Candidatus Pacearchaeota archaeon]HDZ61221.1 hypothetical protein [Candidatus Pacearchaeota archaeon]